MSAPKRFCLRGHDTFVVGRRPSRACRECERMYDSRRHQTLAFKVRIAAWGRRRYTDPARKAKRDSYNRAWALSHPERTKEIQRKSYLKYKGVNFWVEAAKESV